MPKRQKSSTKKRSGKSTSKQTKSRGAKRTTAKRSKKSTTSKKSSGQGSKYNIYIKKALSQIKAENPNLSHSEAFVKAAQQWSTAPENPKNINK